MFETKDVRRQDHDNAQRHEVQDLLRELVRWSDGNSHYGKYCKLCGGEGIDVEHDEGCPVPDVAPALNVPAADIGVLKGLVMTFVVRGDEDGADEKVCKLCGEAWVRHRAGCPIMPAWKTLGLGTVFRCRKCGIREERPFYGMKSEKGICPLCATDQETGCA
jgi:hypothetical protein